MSWRDGYGGTSLDSRGVEDGSGDRLHARSGQRESTGPGVGTGVGGGEMVIGREDSGRIGTGEVNRAVDDGVRLSLV